MSPKRELSNIKKIRYEIKALEDAITEIETRLTRISPVLSDMPMGGSGADKMTDGVASMIELKEKLSRKICEYNKHITEVTEKILQMDDPTYRTVLYRYYVLNDSLEKISVAINYSYHYTCRMHGYALLEFEKTTRHDN